MQRDRLAPADSHAQATAPGSPRRRAGLGVAPPTRPRRRNSPRFTCHMPRDDVVIFFGSARNPLRYSLPQAILATPKIFLQVGQEKAPMRPISLRTRPFIFQGCRSRCEISVSQYGQTGLCSTSFGFSTLSPLQGCNKTAESVILSRLAYAFGSYLYLQCPRRQDVSSDQRHSVLG